MTETIEVHEQANEHNLKRDDNLSGELLLARNELSSVRQQLNVQLQKWDRLWEALQTEAEDRNWCSEYDEFAEKNGGPSRESEYDVSFDITVNITRRVTARDADDAQEQAQNEISIHEHRTYDLYGEQAYVTDINIDVTQP